MATKTLVFVHGSDPDQVNTPWMFYHLNPSTYSKRVKSEGEKFDLVYFDFEKATRTTWKSWTARRDRGPPSAAPDIVVALTPTTHIRDQLGNQYSGDPEFPSVIAFYDWVKTQPKESIVSLQIFSHAVIHQPVLFASSYEWGADTTKQLDVTAERDPHDTEFRLRDFEGSNPLSRGDPWASGMTGELAKFRSALAPDVFIKVWGCGEQTYSHNDGAPIRKLINDFLGTKSGKGGDARRATLVLAYLDHVREFFPFRLAERLEVPVWAGAVGWGSDPFEIDGDIKDYKVGGKLDKAAYARDKYTWSGMFPPKLDKQELWWRMSLRFRRNKPVIEKFFKGTLRAQFDPMGYVEYTKAWVEKATDVANATLNAGVTATPARSVLNAPTELMNELLERIKNFGSP